MLPSLLEAIVMAENIVSPKQVKEYALLRDLEIWLFNNGHGELVIEFLRECGEDE
jgi:hypothetical protein